MKDATTSVVIKMFSGLNAAINFFLVDDSSEHKKAEDMNKNVVATISHNEYIDVSLNHKCSRHSMHRIQSKNHRIGTYEIKKFLCHPLMKKMDMMDMMDMMDCTMLFQLI